ncbi:hypothetical protein E0Z10_g5221 [Xylaria hypoxylon]|uniref:VPS9 domain-containing protein n=1 Tax=Xylaria hypoxylon TaxID=37992 RepID=A0A4Z0YVX4_9PEZI|nr:hypothetical protein E0Z10_g5221 [Xylaria hypoxylon]
MSSSSLSKGSEPRPEPRPEPPKSSRSFPHPPVLDTTDTPSGKLQRANTFQNGTTPEAVVQDTSQGGQEQKPDAFESQPAEEEEVEIPRASVDIGIIPIELVSMADNFIDSLSAKVHPIPPNIDNLARMFQDFYHTAAQHIQTHIASLATRQTREYSLNAASSSRTSAASLLRAKAASIGTRDKTKTAQTPEPEQQMLTAEEFTDRKRARKALEQKKILLEEAVERRLCEGIYDRIYRHRSTQDEAQDDKLRSKTAALAVVGIGPADLGVDLGESPEEGPEALVRKNEKIGEYLEQARKDLILMNHKRYPLGKLNCLKAAHKSIVDTLSYFHPSSSADEIMPMLIYTLITMPPENLNVISDSNFIQRFRWEEKLEGETAYCLTNLEAAITFLQTVDLASLRAEEAFITPSRPGISKSETFPPAFTAGLSTATSSPVVTTPENVPGTKPGQTASSLRATVQRRRLSDLIQTPAQAIGTASDSFFNTADQGIKTIGSSLNESYRFLLGKLRDNSADGREIIVPRTLDDARKLVGTPPPEDAISLDDPALTHHNEDVDRLPGGRDDKLFALVAGKKAVRDHSTDSIRSGRSTSSSKKVVFAEDGREKAAPLSQTPPAASSNPALVESMRNLGSSLNPISRLSGMNMMRGFGRTATTPTPPSSKDAAGKTAEGGDLATAFPDIAASLPPKDAPKIDLPKIDPPKKRFIELQNPADLRLGEVLELLRDYRRLAGALKDMDAFKE